MEKEHYLSAAQKATAWPFAEARKLLVRLKAQKRDHAVFETGYGPSGLPHIGTFGEVVRTSMVRHALQVLAPEISTSLLCFSDDMDGLRKIPDNYPHREKMEPFLNLPLTRVPDLLGEYDSYGARNNARLKAFLDSFNLDYTFVSATDYYTRGLFNAGLQKVLDKHAEVLSIILPTLGKERQATYSPFLPVCPTTGKVLMAKVTQYNSKAGTIVYENPDTKKLCETSVFDGACKLQWKVDWAMRWTVLAVGYEMSGKDLIDSVRLSSSIARVLGATPPQTLIYELFLDSEGHKISKSLGNGLTIEEWLKYAPEESLALYMFLAPRKAKRLHFDVIPKTVDDYLAFVRSFEGQTPEQRVENPLWHIQGGGQQAEQAARQNVPISFSLLLNLVSASNADSPDMLWSFIQRTVPEVSPQSHPMLHRLVTYAVRYFHDIVKARKNFRLPNPQERAALGILSQGLKELGTKFKDSQGKDSQDKDSLQDSLQDSVQSLVYQVGKEQNFALKDWFCALYEILLGQQHGPRLGSFIALYGLEESIELIDKALAGKLVA